MTDHKMTKLYETQISLTEWLERMGHTDTRAMRDEDNTKRERIGVMNKIIGIPYDKPEQFDGIEVVEKGPKIQKLLEDFAGKLCAIRLIPKKEYGDLPKLRTRGVSYADALKWFEEQNVEAEKYTVDFVPHPPDCPWATIFVVNNIGIFGEVHTSWHNELTQGFYSKDQAPMTFSYDFDKWSVEPFNQAALDYVKSAVKYIEVSDIKLQTELKKQVDAEFANNYIKGYFETFYSEGNGTWFIDYNRILGKEYEDFELQSTNNPDDTNTVSGRSASNGSATGTVQIVKPGDDVDSFPESAVLVCEMTSPDYLPFMQKACAIITDMGGILCHAAIVARELKKPCIVGTGNATKVLKTGDKVYVDAGEGSVRKI
jgi:phosphoenolpyruvate synthase/pyruvate phosphate dikinase